MKEYKKYNPKWCKDSEFKGVYYFSDMTYKDEVAGISMYDFYYIIEDVEEVIKNNGELVGKVA